MDGNVVARFRKNAREEIVIRFTEYGGYALADLRLWYEDRDTGDLRPGKGFAIRRELLPELRKAVEAAEKTAREEPGP
jgi:hypothetical protein